MKRAVQLTKPIPERLWNVASSDKMEMGRRFMRHWAMGRTQNSLLGFLPESSNTKLTTTNVIAGIFKTVDERVVLAAKRKPGISCSQPSVTTREFSSDGVERRRKKLMPLQERKMIDKFRLHVRGGDGGAGCSSVRKGRQSRYGSADGGNGGFGGDVILVGSAAVWDLSNLQHHLNGSPGGQGSSKKKVGSRGKDQIVQVPVGTVIHITRGCIPSLEQVLPSQDEPIWEEWEGEPSHEESNLSFEKSQCVGTEWPTEREDLGMKCLAPPDLSRKCGQNPRAGSLQDSKLQVQSLDPDEQGFLEGSGHSSVSQTPGSNSDEETSMSSEGSDSDGISDEEDDDDNLKQEIQSSVAEFIKVGQRLTVAKGGVGGKGNAAMARGRGSEKTLPSFEHEPGHLGSEADLILELKTIADVGLVGAPNAGKSTLLGSMTKAKAVTGHYKFTTLRPNIGMVEFEDFFSFTVADIPGLIEDAHKNRGLGHAFLRHIERTKVLAYVLDLAGGIGDDTGPSPWDQFEELVFELEQYQKGLSQRPSIVIANKIDEEGVMEALEVLKQKVPFLEICGVCAVLDEGVEELKVALRRLVESSQTNSPSLKLNVI